MRKRIVLIFFFIFFFLNGIVGYCFINRDNTEKVLRTFLVNKALEDEFVVPATNCIINVAEEKLKEVPKDKLPPMKEMANLGDIFPLSDPAEQCSTAVVIRKANKLRAYFKDVDYITVIEVIKNLSYVQASKRLVVLSKKGIKII